MPPTVYDAAEAAIKIERLERENAALRADLDWLDKNLDSFACQQLFGEEQDIGKLREMIAKERKLEEKL
jgi:hypothetical protein